MVYLIHFDTPLHHARHYIGFCRRRLNKRIKKHRANNGARILKALNEQGIGWQVVKVWLGPMADRTFERRLKNMKGARHLCPVCNTCEAAHSKRDKAFKLRTRTTIPHSKK